MTTATKNLPEIRDRQAAQDFYHENQIFTASREELILILYDGALRFGRQGLAAGEEHNWAQAGYYLVRAERIVHYLSLCLDLEAGGEIAKKLDSLYEFILRCLSEGHLLKKKERIEDSLAILKILRAAWDEGVVKSGQVKNEQA